MSTGPLVDVLIPVFNGGPWLRQSIESIRAQTHRHLRIHVVDDGSTDASPAILEELAALDDRIRVHRKPNGGIVDALNHGLRFCSADWLARHDADDVADPERLEKQLDYLLRHTDCVAVSAMARHIDDAGRSLGTATNLLPPEFANPAWFPAREPYLMHPFLTVWRAAVSAVGGYRHSPYSEDSDLYWRLSKVGRLHNLMEPLGDYRMHPKSITGSSIFNGRLMAIGSQLAAISAQRQSRDGSLFPFDKNLVDDLRSALSLGAMVPRAAARLDAVERGRFELAVSAKLLELTTYLPYELDPDDAAFIALAYRRGRRQIVMPGNRRSVARQLTMASVRLWGAGRRREALHLLPADLMPEFAGRLALRFGWAAAAFRRLRAWRGARAGSLS